jgi:hypothetical protein
LSSAPKPALTAQHFDWAIFRDFPHGGFRFPSEVEGLRWSDVDWAESRFTVHEKKVERHPCRGCRVVPIFVELRPHLEREYRERAPGAVYVVPSPDELPVIDIHSQPVSVNPLSATIFDPIAAAGCSVLCTRPYHLSKVALILGPYVHFTAAELGRFAIKRRPSGWRSGPSGSDRPSDDGGTPR